MKKHVTLFLSLTALAGTMATTGASDTSITFDILRATGVAGVGAGIISETGTLKLADRGKTVTISMLVSGQPHAVTLPVRPNGTIVATSDEPEIANIYNPARTAGTHIARGVRKGQHWSERISFMIPHRTPIMMTINSVVWDVNGSSVEIIADGLTTGKIDLTGKSQVVQLIGHIDLFFEHGVFKRGSAFVTSSSLRNELQSANWTLTRTI